MKDKIKDLECKEFGVNDLWINLTYNGKRYVGCITEDEELEDLE